jgi:CRP/FNR family transcriptional regulator, cyclic AMP receptor protein
MIATTDKRQYLSMVEIFQDLAPADMEHLEQVTAMVTCERGRVFYNPDEPAEVLFILKRGEVAISRISPDGRKLTIDTLGPGSIFGEMSVVGQRMYDHYAEALTECVICVMSRLDVEELLIADPRVSVRLIQALGERLARAEARIEEMAFKGVQSRVASLLLRLALDTDWRGRPVLAGLTHQQLAELTGATRETVTVTLNQFRESGLVEIARKKVTLMDRAGLQEIAES